MASDTAASVSSYLLNTKSLPASRTWLSSFLASQRNIPLHTLSQAAVASILASDFTQSLSPATSQILPPDVCDPNIKERSISGPIAVQVLDIEDIGSSLWSQVEAIERVERGETVRGREIIRTVMRDEGGDSTVGGTSGDTGTDNNVRQGGNSSTMGPHRLVLQDARGASVVAIELKPIGGVGINELPIGAKLLLKNAIVARGMVLLEPRCVTLLGGKLEDADNAWKSGRKEAMLAKIQRLQT